MKLKKPNLLIVLLLDFIFVISTLSVSADGKLNIQEQNIEFSKSTLTLKEALDELNQLQDITVVYGKIDDLLKIKIQFSSKKLTVQKAVNEIEKAAPVDILFNNNHIIVKKRELSTSYILKGVVKDATTLENLTGAYVYISRFRNGTVSNENGRFSMSVAPGSYHVACRFVGYNEQVFEIDLFQDKTLEFLMEIKENEISEVQVEGSYTELEVLERGRPIETIDAKVIDQLNTNNVNDALHGRLNGVWTTKVSGAPGDHHRIRIRGINSIFGSSDPLYVVDGTIIPIVNFDNIGISDLNSHDIEKITILKDASSTALYGNLGSNGVILIETKKGGGETHFNFGVKQGVQTFSKRYSLLTAEPFLNSLKLSDKLLYTKFYYRNPVQSIFEKYPTYYDSLGVAIGEDDFQEMLFQNGRVSEYQLSGSGNFKTIDYYLSGNYYNHNGIITNSNYNKYTFTANLSKVIKDKASVRLLYKGSHQENKNTLDNYLGNNVIFKGINYEPAYLATPDSFFRKPERLQFNDITSSTIATLAKYTTSPNELFYEHNKIKTDNANSLNLQGFYKLNSELTFRALMSLTIRNQVNLSNIQKSASSYVNPRYYLTDINDFGSGNRLRSDETFIYFCQHYDLNYTKAFKHHNLNALLRIRNFKDNAYWAIDSVSNVYYDEIQPTDDVFLRGSQAIYGEKGSVLRTINSGVLNVNYNYKKKYFASFITNLESIKENEYFKEPDLFYSVALNWDLAREELFRLPNFIDAFNISANIGKSGNFPLNSLADDLFSFSGKYTSGGVPVDAVYISNLANSKLVQEGVLENNYGIEVSLFKERFIVSADYYKKHYSNLLIKRTIPLYYGGGLFYQNIGEMKNEGLELSLDATIFENANFYWNTRMGFSTNEQMVTKLLDNTPINFNNTDVLIPDFIAKENEVLGSIIGYNYIGKWKEIQTEEDNESSKNVNVLGMAYEKIDTLNLTKITEKDKTVIGNSIPDFTFNWINTIEYKNFTCEMLWYGVAGVDKYNATKASTYISGVNTEVQKIIADTMKFHTSNVFYESSFFVEDASFIRLKTLSFKYRPSKKIASKIGMEFMVSFENLITLTRYSGYDPEAVIYTHNNFTDNAIDKGAYPNPQGVYFSINLTF